MLGIAIVVPFISTAVVQATGGSTVATFPPFQCYTRTTDTLYYTYVLPVSTLMGIGITLVILILHVIVHVTALKTSSLQEKDLKMQVSYLLYTVVALV